MINVVKNKIKPVTQGFEQMKATAAQEHPKAVAVGKEISQHVRSGSKISEIARKIGSTLGKVGLSFLKGTVLPNALAALTALCEELFVDDPTGAAIRLALLELTASPVNFQSISANMSWNLVMVNLYENCFLSHWRTRGTEAIGYVSDITFSYNPIIAARDANNAWIDAAIQQAAYYSISVDHFANNRVSQADTRMGPPMYLPHPRVIEQRGLFFGEATPQAIRSLPNNNITVDPSLVTKMLVSVGGNTDSFRTSFAPVLYKLWAFFLLDYPVPILNLSKNVVNNADFATQNDPFPTSVGSYWPLSNGGILPLPPVNAVFIDLSNFLMNYNGTANAQVILPAGFRTDDYNQTCAVVPIIQNMLSNAQALQAWTLAHMEFPWRQRTIECTNAIYNNYNALTINQGDADGGYFSNLGHVRVPGPQARVVYVMLDKFMSDPNNGFTLDLAFGGPQLQLNDMNPVNIAPGFLDNNLPRAPQYHAAMQWYSQLYGSGYDFRTASQAIQVAISRKPDTPRFQPDQQLQNPTNYGMFGQSVAGAPAAVPYVYPATQGVLPPLTVVAAESMVSSFRTIDGRLGLPPAFVFQGQPTHRMYGYSVEAQVLTSTGYFMRVPETMKGEQMGGDEFMADKSVSDLLLRIVKGSTALATLLDYRLQHGGIPCSTYWPNGPMELSSYRSMISDASHVMSHSCYTGFGVLPAEQLQPLQIAWRDLTYTAERRRALPAAQMDLPIAIQQVTGLDQKAWSHLSDSLDVTSERFTEQISFPWLQPNANTSLVTTLYVWTEKTVGNRTVPKIVRNADSVAKKMLPMACQTDRFLTIGNVDPWLDWQSSVFAVGDTTGTQFQYTCISYRTPHQIVGPVTPFRVQQDRPGVLTANFFQPPILRQAPAWFSRDGGQTMVKSTFSAVGVQRGLKFSTRKLTYAVLPAWDGAQSLFQAGELVENTMTVDSMFDDDEHGGQDPYF